MTSARTWIAVALFATAACKGKENKTDSPPTPTEATKAEPVKPAEPLVKPRGPDTVAPQTHELTPKDDADYKAKLEALNKQALAIVSAGETNCDKVTEELEEHNLNSTLQRELLSRYARANPSVAETDSDMKARQKEFETKAAKTLKACKGNMLFVGALVGASLKFD